MDTNQKNETSAQISEESRTLARKARKDLESDSTTSVICPKCHTHPILIISPDGGRSDVSCECGYVYSGEIYF